MKQTIYTPCVRLITKSYTRENRWGGIDDCDPEEPCGEDVEVLVTRRRDEEPTAEIQWHTCECCNAVWSPKEIAQMERNAIDFALNDPFEDDLPAEDPER